MSSDYDINQELFSKKKRKPIQLEKRQPVHHALLQLIKLLEGKMEVMKKGFLDEMQELNDEMESIMIKCEENDERLREAIRGLYEEMKDYQRHQKSMEMQLNI